MSGKNGNGRIGKYQRRVAETAGLKDGDQLPYAPDYFDSLVRRMATPGDFTERTFAWLVYRASGNQDLAAVHLYSHGGKPLAETELQQRDCCLELAWLEAGHRAEWLDAPLDMFRGEAARRGVVAFDRRTVSDGFTENRDRGTVASDTGRRLVLVPSPFVRHSSDKIGENKAKVVPYRTFCTEWNVRHSSEYEEEQVARSTLKRINKVRLSAYKQWLKSETPAPRAGTSLETLESLESLENQPSSSSAVPVTPLSAPNHSDEKTKPKAEEEDAYSWKDFRNAYPPDHLDEAKTRPVFERKTSAERCCILERVGVYLDCDRWKSDGGRWIPLSSSFLKDDAYRAAPPPAIRKQKPEDGQKRWDEMNDTIEAAIAAERAAKQAGGSS